MVRNLQEGFLYALLPEGLLSLDESGVINALLSGYQDRLDDLRAYAEKLTLLMGPNFPESGNNCVLVDLVTSKGNTITRSLEFEEDTPEDGTAELATWAAEQLGLEADYIANVRYGVDPLRQVSADTLQFLADSLGAVIYPTLASSEDAQRADQERILETYFPRLRIKGTARSFVTLARLLGYDDVTFTPLWQRVSPRLPNDPGNPLNNPDFSATPEYYPQQQTSLLYNPHVQDDGAFYSWTGTVHSGTSQNNYYPLINGFSPYFKVTVLTAGQEVQSPPDGTYLLSGGGPHVKATVTPENSGIRFDAISEGESFNGLPIQVTTLNIDSTGTLQALQTDWRLSAIKYRSSFFDLSVVMTFDRAEQIFCTTAIRPNDDLVADPASANYGTVAVSPFRPWSAGSIDTGLIYRDFLVINGTETIVIDPRVQMTGDGTNRQLDMETYFAQGAQAVRTLEEVRPATRFIRRAGVGFAVDEAAQFAPYVGYGTLFSTTGTTGTYSGWAWDMPLVSTAYVSLNGTFMVAEADPFSGTIWHYGLDGVTGTVNFNTGSYLFVAVPDVAGTLVTTTWEMATTGTIRPEPTWQQKYDGLAVYQDRPEDEANGNVYETTDEYPWRREPVINGVLLNTDFVRSVQEEYVDVLDSRIALTDQSGANYELYGAVSASGRIRLTWLLKEMDPYLPGQVAVAVMGNTKNLADIPAAEMLGITPATDLETYYESGAQMYHVGLVQNVLVADPVSFFGTHHTEGLWSWLPANEHVDDALTVHERSNTLSTVTLSGILSTDRVYDEVHGWYLKMTPGARFTWTRPETPPEAISLSFWLTALGNTALVGEDEIFRYGPLSITIEHQSATMRIFATDPSGVDQQVGLMYPNYDEWHHFSIVWTPDSIAYRFEHLDDDEYELTPPVTAAIVSRPLLETETSFTWACDHRDFGVRDIRIWNREKTLHELFRTKYHDPVPTPVCYPIPSFAILTTGDLYTLKVLPNGWVVPSPDPTRYENQRLVWQRRYDYQGAYIGPEQYKETGLGGGRRVTVPYRLGMQFYNLTADGQTVVSTEHGMLPGINRAWDVHLAGTYATLVGAGVSGSGTTVTWAYSGTTSPWPNTMVETNPCVGAIWIRGDDRYVWRVTVESTTTGAQLVAEKPFTSRSDSEIALLQSVHSYGDRTRARFAYPPTYPNIIHPLVPNPTTDIAYFDDKMVVRADLLFTVAGAGTYTGVDLYRAYSADYTDFRVDLLIESGGSIVRATPTEIPLDDTYWTYASPGITWAAFDFPSTFYAVIVSGLAAGSKVYAVYTVNTEHLQHSEQPTGAVTEIAIPGTVVSVSLTGEVYQKLNASGTVTRPYAYLYSERTLLEDVDNAYDRWTEADNPQPCANRLPIPDPIAGLASNGILEFTNTAPLVPGFYRLEITSGNIGQPDEAFDGFNVEIQVDATLLQRRLLAGMTGYNVTGTDTFEFEIETPSSGSEWLLTINWLNAFSDESAGVARRLAIYSYRLYRLSRNLYQVSIALTGTTPNTDLLYTDWYTGSTPGGYMMALDSQGVPVRWQHESTIYPSNDTVVSTLPVSELLTGSTHNRLSDVLVRNGTAYDFILVDAGTTAMPAFTGTVAVT